jgi:hypothetical protein
MLSSVEERNSENEIERVNSVHSNKRKTNTYYVRHLEAYMYQDHQHV